MKRILCVAFIIFSMGISTANAIPVAPSLKPAPVVKSKVVSEKIYINLADALDAADSNNWSKVRKLYKQSNDSTVKQLLLWRITTNSKAQPSFSELEKGLSELSDWPKTREMQKQAESLLVYENLSSKELDAWFSKYPPMTGVGKLAYAKFLKANNKTSEAKSVIKDVWLNYALPSSAEKEILLVYGSTLTRADHSARVDMLLWGNQRSSAKRLLKRLSSPEQKLVQARLALMEGRRGVDNLMNAVPKKYQSDQGLLYERAKWRRRKAKNYDGAIESILQISPEGVSSAGLSKIWNERSILLRSLIKERRWPEAYKIAADHGMTKGVGFAEAEFYAGWVSLKHLNENQTAFEHFDTLAKGVGSPISLSRGLYWRGEALTALKRNDEALESYKEAAQLNFTFYGQMAAQRLRDSGLSEAELAFSLPEAVTEEQKQGFHDRPLIKAAILLAETGRLKSFERFSFHIDDSLKTPQEHQILFDLALHYLEPRAGIRNGKAGLANGVVTPDAAFPVIELPNSAGSGIAEPALVLALSRQESELTPTAISHANARGMMQLLPSTGRLTARNAGLPYRQSWLTDDPTYNFRVGRRYLDDLIEEFDGSYILALAAYNAGPSRPKRWIKEYGDPRKGEIDPIDFIESIPFSETRNYVQRILENTQVYRHRLSGNPISIALSKDLMRGGVSH